MAEEIDETTSSPDVESEPRKSAATVLVELALDGHRMGMSADGEPFAVPLSGPRLIRPLRGGKLGLRAELAKSYRNRTSRVAGQQALADALLALEGEAAEAEPEPLALRVGQHLGRQYLDLGDNTGQAIEVGPDGWTVLADPPVLFRRSALTSALPTPERGGNLAELWALLNVAPQDRPLLAAWLVSVLYPEIPHPIPALLGEQGTGKTSAAKMLASVLDPSPVPVRKSPRDADSWVTAASGSWVVALDNLSVVSEWLSDTLCRAVTGDGDVRRQLYTDGGLVVFAFRRCVLLTGIDLGALRGDLADRLLPVDLHVIPDTKRREESGLWPEWERAQPRILGAVLDLAASVARVQPSVRLESRPRMADFGRILAAVDQVLGTEGYRRYTERAGSLAAESLTADPFVVALAGLPTADLTEKTAAELLASVPAPERPVKGWPTNARAVTALLKRQAPVMRRAGWTVVEQAPGHENAIRWNLRHPEKAGKPDSQHSHTRTEREDARNASDEYGQSQDDEPIPLFPDDPAALVCPDHADHPDRECPDCQQVAYLGGGAA